jgi:outer membrane lipopolysaccharide assembly protein LptE/RlpB
MGFGPSVRVKKPLPAGRQAFGQALRTGKERPMTLPLNRTGIVTVTLLCLILLMGCGYHMVGRETHVPPGLTSLAVPTFVNQTVEPGIEVPFTQGFLRELINDQRVKVVGRGEAAAVLEGVIKSFQIYSVSYDRSGLVQEYQTSVIVDLTLRKQSGEVLWAEKDLSESRWYRASFDPLVSESRRAAAIQQIARLVADRMRSRIFYRF